MNNTVSVAALFLAAAVSSQAQLLDISVSNEAPAGGLYFTPVWMGFHDGSFDLFTPGTTASSALEVLAEDGNPAPLDALFGSASGRQSLVVTSPGGPGPGIFAPGASGSGIIDLDPVANRFVTLASMIVPSNDAFFGPTVELFDASGMFLGLDVTVLGSMLWDAGTEVNDTMGAAFSTVGGSPTDENGVVSLFPDLSNFIGTTVPTGATIDSVFGRTDSVATIQAVVVPEPATNAALLIGGLVAFYVIRRVRKQRAA